MRILLTGATGYVGGRLGAHLLEAGYHIRCLVRSKEKLKARVWADDPRVDCREADFMDTDALAEQLPPPLLRRLDQRFIWPRQQAIKRVFGLCGARHAIARGGQERGARGRVQAPAL